MSSHNQNVLENPDEQPPDQIGVLKTDLKGGAERSLKINQMIYAAPDRHQTARDLLRIGGLNPASDYVLIQLLRPGSVLVGLDQEVDLGKHGQLEYRAFLSGEVFPFTADEVGYVWGAESISESDLRDITGAPKGMVFVLAREDEPDEMIEPGESLDLAARGTEHIRIEKWLVTLFYGDDSFELARGTYTGAQLAEIFGVLTGYELDLIKKNGKFDPIAPDDTVKINEGMHFASHPPSGQSS